MDSFLTPAQDLLLEHIDGSRVLHAAARVVKVDPGMELSLLLSPNSGLERRLHPETRLRAEVQKGKDFWTFTCTVLQVQEESSGMRLLVSWPGDVERIQRRDNFRLSVDIRADVFVAESAPLSPLPSRTVDLSVGGVRLLLSTPLQPGTPVTVHLHLPGRLSLNCEGTVIRGGNHSQKSDFPFWAAVEFSGVSPSARKEITLFISQLELAKRRGDLL